MTPEEFKEKMKRISDSVFADDGDEEEGHIAMDALMGQVLTELGYGEGVDIFWETPRWYA